MIYATCPICDFKFEVEDYEEIDGVGYSTDGNKGECPNCKASYEIADDCNDPIDAILIADFDYYHMGHEESKAYKEKLLSELKNKP